MSLQEVSAKTGTGIYADTVFTVKYDLPDTVSEAVSKYGEEVVYSRFKASLVIDLQAFMRAKLTGEKFDSSTLQAAVDGWQPGVRAKGKSVAEKVQDLLSKLTPEQRAELFAEFA